MTAHLDLTWSITLPAAVEVPKRFVESVGDSEGVKFLVGPLEPVEFPGLDLDEDRVRIERVTFRSSGSWSLSGIYRRIKKSGESYAGPQEFRLSGDRFLYGNRAQQVVEACGLTAEAERFARAYAAAVEAARAEGVPV